MSIKKIISFLSAPVALLAAGHLVVDLYSGFIIPILPFIARKLDISLPMAGLIVSLTGLTASFLQPIYGYFSDRITKRFFVFWGLIISSIFISLTGAAWTYLLLAITVVVGNIGVGLYHPQATAYTGRLKSSNLNVNMGIFVAGGIIGYALGPMLSSSIVYFLGLEWTPLAAIPGLIAACLVYFFLPRIDKIDKQKPPVKTIFKNLANRKDILTPIVLIVIIRSLMLMAMSTYFPFEWEDNLGYSVLTVGIVMTVFSFAGGISSIVGGSLAGRYGERKILLLSFLLPLPLLLGSLHLMPTHGILSFILYIIGGAVLESTISVNIVMAQKVVPEHIGIVSGITGGFCWGIAGFLMFPIGIAITYFNIYVVTTTVLMLTFVALYLIITMPRKFFDQQDPLITH